MFSYKNSDFYLYYLYLKNEIYTQLGREMTEEDYNKNPYIAFFPYYPFTPRTIPFEEFMNVIRLMVNERKEWVKS